MAEKRMMAPNTTIWAIPVAAIDDITDITVAEINAGTNISCAIVEGYTLNPTDSDTDDTRSICDEGNVSTMTDDNYEVSFTFFRDDNIADNTSVYNTAFNLMKQPVELVFVKRLGKKSTVPAAVGDVVSWYSAETDYVQEGDAKGQPKQFTVPGLPSGTMILNRELTA